MNIYRMYEVETAIMAPWWIKLVLRLCRTHERDGVLFKVFNGRMYVVGERP